MTVTAPLGFRAAGVTAGLKASGHPDLAVVLNDGPSWAGAAVFTANRVKAAPVRWTEQVARGGQIRAVVLNSGGAMPAPARPATPTPSRPPSGWPACCPRPPPRSRSAPPA